MILIDFSGVVFGALHTDLQSSEDINENFFRHLVLNKIRSYRKKYKEKYGEIVICCDGRGYWRKKEYKYYKYKRAVGRAESDLDWDKIFEVFNKVKEELIEYFPYKVLQLEGCEADDIIGTLCKNKDLFEDIMIISADKDFKQLQRYEGVKQWSPMTKKLITEKKPLLYLKEHIIRGDGGDGVPNFLSPDNHFTLEGARQKPIRQKDLDNWLFKTPEEICGDDKEWLKRYRRNEKMVDLAMVPQDLQDAIMEQFAKEPKGKRSKIYMYLMKNKMRLMLDHIQDF